jgi:bacteriocin-like protein
MRQLTNDELAQVTGGLPGECSGASLAGAAAGGAFTLRLINQRNK